MKTFEDVVLGVVVLTVSIILGYALAFLTGGQ